jgi:MOSC domain-containing protein YiiM
MEVIRIYRCAEHVYVGHKGRPAGTARMTEVPRARLLAGRGVEGDRYSRVEGAKGQVTFFAEEAWQRLCRELGRSDRGPDVFRRNILVRGADLNSLIGREFEVQGVRFRGVEHCRPCFWMEEAFAPGTLALLGEWRAGGLRASVLNDGWLAPGSGEAERCSA